MPASPCPHVSAPPASDGGRGSGKLPPPGGLGGLGGKGVWGAAVWGAGSLDPGPPGPSGQRELAGGSPEGPWAARPRGQDGTTLTLLSPPRTAGPAAPPVRCVLSGGSAHPAPSPLPLPALPGCQAGPAPLLTAAAPPAQAPRRSWSATSPTGPSTGRGPRASGPRTWTPPCAPTWSTPSRASRGTSSAPWSGTTSSCTGTSTA